MSAYNPEGTALEHPRPATVALDIPTQEKFVIKQSDNALDPLIDLPVLSSIFMQPLYLASSAWLGHIPFAFWIIEAHKPQLLVELGTHYGVSYFAFCQAIERFGLDTSCFAIDTWKGDEQSGFYDESVYTQVKKHNDLHYSAFSSLIRNSFDKAVDYFTDNTIDLLHIDGLHTYDAVKHDFETWQPKLSDRAIVVLHDSNVHEREFGVFKFVQELRNVYPSFEFIHEHGLTIFGVGPNQNLALNRLFSFQATNAAKNKVHKLFSLLARHCFYAHNLNEQTNLAGQAKAERDKLLLERDALAKDLETAKTQCDDIQASLKTKRQQLRRQAHRLLGQLVLSLLGYPPHASLPADIHKEKEILQKTKLVDSTWYLKMYKDVAKANMNPVLHYLRYGIKEGRIPSPIFAFDEVYTEEKLRALMVVQDSALAQLKT
jgi:hypothetical protein